MGYPRTHLAAATAVASANRFLLIGNGVMQNAAYTLEATKTMPEAGTARHITITHAVVGGVADTLGTVTIVGTDIRGLPQTEVMTPTSGGLATSSKWFASIVSATGAGWTRNAGAGSEDTITIGCAADAIIAEGAGTVHAISVNTTAAGTITVADAAGTIAVLKSNIAEGFYLLDADWSGYLKLALGAASDITVLHTGSLPGAYAMS